MTEPKFTCIRRFSFATDVVSASEPGKTWTVRHDLIHKRSPIDVAGWSCTCPAWHFRSGGQDDCKHVRSIREACLSGGYSPEEWCTWTGTEPEHLNCPVCDGPVVPVSLLEPRQPELDLGVPQTPGPALVPFFALPSSPLRKRLAAMPPVPYDFVVFTDDQNPDDQAMVLVNLFKRMGLSCSIVLDRNNCPAGVAVSGERT